MKNNLNEKKKNCKQKLAAKNEKLNMRIFIECTFKYLIMANIA